MLKKLRYYPKAVFFKISLAFTKRLLSGVNRWKAFESLNIHGFGDEMLRLDFPPKIPPTNKIDGGPTARVVTDWFAQHASKLDAFASEVKAQEKTYSSFPIDQDPSRPHLPWKNNDFFGEVDTKALLAVIKRYSPKRYIEIGSGMSTRVAAFCQAQGVDFDIQSIDPEPRVEIENLANVIKKVRVEDLDAAYLLDSLDAGDVLFIDGSHRVFPGGDVVHLFLNVIPFLKKGVIIHIHDIYLPSDYPSEFDNRLWSEQYILAALIIANQGLFEPIFSSQWWALTERGQIDLGMSDSEQSIVNRGSSLWLEVKRPIEDCVLS